MCEFLALLLPGCVAVSGYFATPSSSVLGEVGTIAIQPRDKD